jgi:hypothetical protein
MPAGAVEWVVGIGFAGGEPGQLRDGVADGDERFEYLVGVAAVGRLRYLGSGDSASDDQDPSSALGYAVFGGVHNSPVEPVSEFREPGLEDVEICVPPAFDQTGDVFEGDVSGTESFDQSEVFQDERIAT